MALTGVDYEVYAALRKASLIPPHPSVLELGESEWYGDLPPEKLTEIIDSYSGARAPELRARLADILAGKSRYPSWDLAKVFYSAMLDYRSIKSIDFHGTPDALQINLNQPTGLTERFDMVIDGGTAEHVFNVFQLFKSCHDLTRPGGLIIHSLPFCGWLEHGFYSFNPTFYWDLAAANGYAMLMLVYSEIDPVRIVQLERRERIVEMARAGEIGRNALLYAVLRKGDGETEFRAPDQGYYTGGLSDEMSQAWRDLR